MSNANTTKHKLRTKLILIYLIVFGIKFAQSSSNDESDADKTAAFQFPEFDYKENNKNELAYRDRELTCEQTDACESIEGLERIKCIRKCISSSCYTEIYEFDPLEDGEIDVRLQSFKGCFIQRISKPTKL